ncbi:MAG: peroxiredoxin [Gammaproteobacteria bacterium]|nr:peroxiredoxin [Gammaproteobacteria bacterium]
MTELSIGSEIADFEGQMTDDKVFKLSDFRGQYVVLYFYPRDNTPGCTTEGKDFAQNIKDFEGLNTVVFGISRDTLNSHQKFKEKCEFPFQLITDTDESICNQFDVIKMKNMYGKQVRGIERSTFLISPDSVLLHEWRKVRVKEHVQAVLDVVRQQTSA